MPLLPEKLVMLRRFAIAFGCGVLSASSRFIYEDVTPHRVLLVAIAGAYCAAASAIWTWWTATRLSLTGIHEFGTRTLPWSVIKGAKREGAAIFYQVERDDAGYYADGTLPLYTNVPAALREWLPQEHPVRRALEQV